MDNIEKVIKEEIASFLDEPLKIADLSNDVRIESLGMASIDWATLLAVLEAKLHKTPFDSSISATDVGTISDLILAYQDGDDQAEEAKDRSASDTRSTARKIARARTLNKIRQTNKKKES